MVRKQLSVALLLCCLIPGPLNAQQAGRSPAAASLSGPEKLYGLSKIWMEAKYNFPYFDQIPGLNWDSVYQAYIPQVTAAESPCEYYRVLQRFIAVLKDGHTNVYMPESAAHICAVDSPWILLEEVEHRAIVANIGRSMVEMIPIGSEVLLVDGVPVENHLREKVFPYIGHGADHVLWNWGIQGNTREGYGLLAGPANVSVQLRIRTPDGAIRELQASRNRRSRPDVWSRALPPQPQLIEYRDLGSGITYVALNGFGNRKIVNDFEDLLPRLRGAGGVILDLRRNTGGSLTTGKMILQHFTRDTLPGFQWHTRVHNAAYATWGRWADQDPWAKQYEAYFGHAAWQKGPVDSLKPASGPKIDAPLVILIGHNTASAGEDLLVFLDGTGRAILVGQPTNGSSGEPLYLDLPGGGQARIVSYRETYPDGRRTLIDQGVQPDVRVEATVEDIQRGRDAALEAGVQVLKERMNLARGRAAQPGNR